MPKFFEQIIFLILYIYNKQFDLNKELNIATKNSVQYTHKIISEKTIKIKIKV